MSVTHPKRVRCPHCGDLFDADLYWSLHATRAPDVRDAILEQRFQRFACPACGGTVLAEPTMLYTDFPRRQWFATFPRTALRHHPDLRTLVEDGFTFNMRTNAPAMVRGWAEEMTVRLVFGLPKLREKLLLADAGLDDRVVEVLLLQLVRDTSVALFRPDTHVVVEAIHDAHLEVAVTTPAQGDRTEVLRVYDVDRAAYDRLFTRREQLARDWPELFEGPVVDWRASLVRTEPLPRAPDDATQRLVDRLYPPTP